MMSAIFLPIIYVILLFADMRTYAENPSGADRRLYITLAVAAVALAIPAGLGVESDHVGASLSGMTSLFMR